MSSFTSNSNGPANLNYSEQLQLKIEKFRALISPYYDGNIDCFESPESEYRMRTEFRIWHDGDRIDYAMFKPGTKELCTLSEFPIASAPIQRMMPMLLESIHSSETLKNRLFSTEFLSTQFGELLVTLIYHRALDDTWEKAAIALQEKLDIQIIGRSRKQKIVLSQDFVTESFSVANLTYQYRQYENSFTQPNASINQQMLNWVCSQALGLGEDLLELYCGNGNFTLPLSKLFRKVLTTEISKSSIAALQWNIENNAIDNIDHARLSAEEITQALDGVRPFRRLAHLDLMEYNFSTVFVDPPRAGVDDKSLKFLSRFKNIIYVSCNPETLRNNLDFLNETHSVVSAAAFDQFPFTPHLESAVRLKAR